MTNRVINRQCQLLIFKKEEFQKLNYRTFADAILDNGLRKWYGIFSKSQLRKFQKVLCEKEIEY